VKCLTSALSHSLRSLGRSKAALFRAPHANVRCMKKIITLLSVIFLQGCAEHYSELEAEYAIDSEDTSESFNISTVTLSSRTSKGAYNLRNNIDVTLNEKSIKLKVEFPFSYMHKPIVIPAKDVSGCGKACFSKESWHTELYISKTGTTIGVHNSNTLINWCWKNKIPIIPGKIERAWKYNGASLPPKKEFSSKFKSQENYIYLAKQSCLGY